jgi:hypothetical protein
LESNLLDRRLRAIGFTLLFPSSLEQQRTDNDHCQSPNKKSNVPVDSLGSRHQLVDVMNAQDFVINNSLDKVENTPPQEKRANQQLIGPIEVPMVSGSPQDEKPDHHENVRAAVKDTVPKRVQFEVRDCRRRIPTAHHVMPLKDLVKDNPVEEPAKTKAEQDTG